MTVIFEVVGKEDYKYPANNDPLRINWTREMDDYIMVLMSEGLHRGNNVGWTAKIKNLENSIDSLKVKLTEEDLKEISDAATIEEVSKLGVGCMRLTGVYNSPLPEEDGIAVIKYAFSKGITFFDSSDIYGPHTYEILLGKALKQLPREKIQIATKFGIQRIGYPQMEVNSRPEYVRSCCEASLKRLDVEYIDLYYQHRVDTKVPIEETVGELKKLVEEGKVKYIGLSEASPDTIRRAHAVHPITAIQMEWSLWTHDIEEEIIPLCSRIEGLARKHQCTPAQLAIAWVLQQGDDIVAIPGTTKIKNLENNIGSLKVKLTEEDLKEISDEVPMEEVAGSRSFQNTDHFLWKFGNTPPKN
nr:putative aldo-keto reductase 1 [Quercus suber]